MPKPVDVTTPSDLEIQVVRRFRAPADLVFAAHTQPALVRRWLLGPPGWVMSVCEIDLRVGGRYQYRWHNPAGAQPDFGVNGEYRKIAAPHHIVHVERFDGADGESLCRYDLTEDGDETILALTMRFATPAERDRALKSGMTGGMAISYDRLEAEVLAKAA